MVASINGDDTSMTHVRPMEEHDLNRVQQLTLQLGYEAPVGELRTRLTKLSAMPDHDLYVACDDEGRVIGWLHMMELHAFEVAPMAQLAGIVVEAGCRRTGAGTALLAQAEAWARDHGFTTITLRSRTGRDDAHAFYRAGGFKGEKTSVYFQKYLD